MSFEDPGRPGPVPDGVANRKALYAAVWRWHFYAGIFVAPFLALLGATGLVMLAAEPLERWQLGAQVTNGTGAASTTHQARLDAARAVLPAGSKVLYRPGRSPGEATRVTVGTDDEGYSAFVDPGTARVLGTIRDSRLLPVIANRLHGTLFLGAFGDGVIEVAASLGILLLVSGVFLWLPRGAGLREALRIRRDTRRTSWRDLHKATGVLLAPVLGLYLLSGLAWTNVWGGKFVQAWSTISAARAAPRGSREHVHGGLDVGARRVAPWGLEQTPLPVSTTGGAKVPISLDAAVAAAQRAGIGERFCVALPEGEAGVFTISQTGMNGDVTDPRQERVVHVDPYSGEVIGQAGWGDYDLMARGMAAGVPLHMGMLGPWTVASAAGTCLATLLLSGSGVVTWWLRRPARAFRLVAQPRPPRVPLATWLCAGVLCVLFPMAGAALVLVAALDWAVVRRFPALGRALS